MLWNRAERPPWLVRIPDRRGNGAAGGGVLVGSQHVVTCAHVIDMVLDRADPEPGFNPVKPDAAVDVEFLFAGTEGDTGPQMSATVVGWVPIAADGSGDVALLELASPVDITPAPLASPPALSGHRFSAHGFPRGEYAARNATGVLQRASGPRGQWVQVRADGSSGWAIERGFSGTPVFDEDEQAVIGIVALRDDHQTGHLLPVSYLRTLWPEVRRNCGWRLDLDPSYGTHWLPRARGTEIEAAISEWFFTGRTAARCFIRDWLDEKTHAGHPILLVTGGPGSGKSALLAHLLIAVDPQLGGAVPTPGPLPSTGAFDAALYLKGRTCNEVVAQLAAAFGVAASGSDDLVSAVVGLPVGESFVVLADAVEEAATFREAKGIATLLRRLAHTGRVRILAGVRSVLTKTSRAQLLYAFGDTAHRIDLEAPEYLHRPDIAEYVVRRLHGGQTAGGLYGDHTPVQLRTLGEAVARKARYNFLIAQLAVGWLTRRGTPLPNLDSPDWEDQLPETIGQAMDAYLDACGPDTDTVRRVLTALAYAQGDGLPRSVIWLRIAEALSYGATHNAADRETVFNSAALYLMERVDGHTGEPTFRLYHDALGQYLRDQCPHHTPQQAITNALLESVPTRDGKRDWAAADAYSRDHLAHHAATTGQLDELLNDAEYLVQATPRSLTPHLYLARSESAQVSAAIYRTSVLRHSAATSDIRRRILSVDAARAGASSLQKQLVASIPEDDWVIEWSTGAELTPELHGAWKGHSDEVWTIACTDLDGVPVAVTGGRDRKIRIWDLTNGTLIGQPLTEFLPGDGYHVEAIACTHLDGRPVALIANEFEMVHVWDLMSGTRIGEPLYTRIHRVFAIACTHINGAPVAVIGGRGRRVQVWDLASRTVIHDLTGHPHISVLTIACTSLHGKPVAVVGHTDGMIYVWDLTSGSKIGNPPSGGHTSEECAVACSELNGVPVAITGGRGPTIKVWDLASGASLRDLTTHTRWVCSVVCTEVNGAPVAVTAGRDGPVEVWDLASGALIGSFTGHEGTVWAIACTHVNGIPVAVTCDGTRIVRVWELESNQSIRQSRTGHEGIVWAIACTRLDGIPVAVTCDGRRAVHVWDVRSGTLIRSLTEHADPVCAVACTELNGVSAVVTSSVGGTVQAWNLSSGAPIGAPCDVAKWVLTMACTTVDGRLVAVTGSTTRHPLSRPKPDLKKGGSVRVCDLASGTSYPVLGGDFNEGVWAIACTNVNGRSVAVISTNSKDLWVRDLTSDKDLWLRTLDSGFSKSLTGHTGRVHRAVACTNVNGRAIAVTGDDRGIVRLWDLASCTQITEPLTGHRGGVMAAACTYLDGVPIAMTTDVHRSIRMWNLDTGDPAGLITAVGARSIATCPDGRVIVSLGRDLAAFSRRSQV